MMHALPEKAAPDMNKTVSAKENPVTMTNRGSFHKT